MSVVTRGRLVRDLRLLERAPQHGNAGTSAADGNRCQSHVCYGSCRTAKRYTSCPRQVVRKAIEETSLENMVNHWSLVRYWAQRDHEASRAWRHCYCNGSPSRDDA